MKIYSEAACIPFSQLVWAKTSDFIELTKPRLTSLVLFSTLAGFCTGFKEAIPFALLLHTLLGTALMAGGAGALNMYCERVGDAAMKRTARRPLAAGRLRTGQGLLFALALSISGFLYLRFFVNHLTGLLSAAVLLSYVFLYTPLKRRTWAATLIGAVPGALPIVMGWTAANAALSPKVLVIFGIVYLWQIPHFHAIAWMHREDYARAGLQVLSVIDATGKRSGRQAVVFITGLVIVSLIPAFTGDAGRVYLAGAAALGLIFLHYGIAFTKSRDHASARNLFVCSAAYLPALLTLLIISARF